MKVLVLKPFKYSPDGIASVAYAEGDEPDLKDEVIDGLEQEGYIVVGLPTPSEVAVTEVVPAADAAPVTAVILEPGTTAEPAASSAPAAAAVPTPEIPKNWHSLKLPARKALASKIAGREITTSDEANAVIENAKRHQ